MDVASLMAIAGAFLVVTVSPGPANLALATAAMARGRVAALRMAAGLALGLAAWGVAAAAGLGAVLAASEVALTVLKLAGAAYLAWVAVLAGRSARRAESKPPEPADPAGRWFMRGLVLNLANPKAVFAWLAALSVGLSASAGPAGVARATLLCMAIGAANYAAWALVFSLGGAMATYRRLRRWIEGATALMFAAAAGGLVRAAVR